MAGGDIQKLKLMYLYDIFKERTDEGHDPRAYRRV